MPSVQAACFNGRCEEFFKFFFLIVTFSTRACAKWQPAMHQKTIMPGGAAVPMFSRSLRSLIFLGI